MTNKGGIVSDKTKVRIPVAFDIDDDKLLEAAAHKIANRIMADESAKTTLKNIATIRVNALLDKALGRDEEIDFPQTNTYGEPTGKVMTLREFVAKQFQDWLQEKVESDGRNASYHSSNARPRGEWIVSKAVNEELTKIYTAEVQKAVAETRNVLQGKLSAQITAAVAKLFGVTLPSNDKP